MQSRFFRVAAGLAVGAALAGASLPVTASVAFADGKPFHDAGFQSYVLQSQCVKQGEDLKTLPPAIRDYRCDVVPVINGPVPYVWRLMVQDY